MDMRILAFVIAAFALSLPASAQEAGERLSSDEIESWMRVVQVKPGMTQSAPASA